MEALCLSLFAPPENKPSGPVTGTTETFYLAHDTAEAISN